MIARIALAAAVAAPLLIAAPAFAAPSLADGVRIENAAARVIVIPEARGDVSVTTHGGDARLPQIRTRVEGGTVIVDGGLRNRIMSCGVINMNMGALFHHDRERGRPSPGQRVMIRGVGPLTLDHLPEITVHVPMSASVSADGAVWGEAGPSDALRLSASGCGDWRVGDVRGPLDVSTNGSGDVIARHAGGLHAQLSGSGDLAVGDVDRDANIAIAGSGDVLARRIGGRLQSRVNGSGDLKVARADGPIEAQIGGSGDLRIVEGRSPRVTVSVAGSGDFRFGGVAGALDATVAGSGDVYVGRVDGPVSKSVAGSGDIHIGGH